MRKQLVSVIDNATTLVCLDCAGQVRDLPAKFHTLAGDFHQPPFHIWCRSVVIPYLPGFVTEQRSEANAEISRRPLKERRKGPGGVGARIPPPAHAGTLEHRGDLPARDDTSTDTYDRVVTPLRDAAHADALARYLADAELDRHLRAGTLEPDEVDLVTQVDAAVSVGRLEDEITVFTALDPKISRGLRVSDIASSDSYLRVALDPAVAARYGHPLALTLPAGLSAAPLDRDTQQLLLARRHAWRLIALGVILIGVLL